MPDTPAKERLQNRKQVLKVSSVRFVPSPDAEQRLRKVYALLLRNNREESSNDKTRGH
ncbi:MAG: hypothetical protein HQ553_04535 [Chloroflexi bacterium]|nr:hypothetical protein [Chloroflexota bacterium]